MLDAGLRQQAGHAGSKSAAAHDDDLGRRHLLLNALRQAR